MEILNVATLAILQGVAEFLPISSSGHLVIGQHLLGLKNIPGMRLDIFLHVGTLVAVVIYYRAVVLRILRGIFVGGRDAWEYVGKIIISTIPAIILYALLHSWIDSLFEDARAVGAFLIFTGVVVFSIRFIPQGCKNVSFIRALLMGLAQAFAILPGVSRSGMTIVSARAAKVESAAAAEFSFLMSAPLIIGGAVLDLFKDSDPAAVGSSPELSWGLVIFGAVVAAIVGLISLIVLVKMLKGPKFWLFGVYCVVAGIATVCLC